MMSAFKGAGRRLGSTSDSNQDDKKPDSGSKPKDKLWPDAEGIVVDSARPGRRTSGNDTQELSADGSGPSLRRGSTSSTASTASIPPVSPPALSKKRKRRASSASTASLVEVGSSTIADHRNEPSSESPKSGFELIELLTDEERVKFGHWIETHPDLDPIAGIETWYYNIRITSFKSRTRAESKAHKPDRAAKETKSQGSDIAKADLYGKPLIHKTINNTSDAIPGSFQQPKVLKTWCYGYPRERDIKLEEVFQRGHLSSAVVSSFIWDIDFFWSKINGSTPCQLIMQNDMVEPGTKLQDGANRIILHPENTKILHSKFMLLFYEAKRTLRIVISSANMVGFDWGEAGGFMENIVFLVDLPKVSSNYDQPLTQFGSDLHEYCISLGIRATVVDQFKQYDWSQTSELIFIGTEGRVNSNMVSSTGLEGLSTKLAKAGLSHNGELLIDFIASSIGKVDKEFLAYLYEACKGNPKLPKPPQCKNLVELDELVQNVRVYFASRDTVLNSKGGEDNAGTLCFFPNNYYSLSQEKDVFYDCISHRPRCLMHNKIIFVQPKQRSASRSESSSKQAKISGVSGWLKTSKSSTKEAQPEDTDASIPVNDATLHQRPSRPWVYVGSGNCSWAAWAHPKNRRKEGNTSYNTGSNWECGVIIPINDTLFEQGQEGHGEGRNLEIFQSVVPVPMHVNKDKLNPQTKRPYFRPAQQGDFQPPKGVR